MLNPCSGIATTAAIAAALRPATITAWDGWVHVKKTYAVTRAD